SCQTRVERRPPTGIWGGLLALPEIPDAGDDAARWAGERFGLDIAGAQTLAPLTHAFTHFVLELQPVLLGVAGGGNQFRDEAQAQRFFELWTRRWNGVAGALNADVETLEDERTYHPEVMDERGAIATLPEAERAEMADQELPSVGQVWAMGFLYVVDHWADDWAAPRDKET
ncbi:MAG: NUDIX domain-containing protein, partial [Gammaproteobacteria bacterium]